MTGIDHRKWPHNTPWGWHRRSTDDVIASAGLVDADLRDAVRAAATTATEVRVNAARPDGALVPTVRLTRDGMETFGNVLNAAIDEQDRRRNARVTP